MKRLRTFTDRRVGTALKDDEEGTLMNWQVCVLHQNCKYALLPLIMDVHQLYHYHVELHLCTLCNFTDEGLMKE